MFYCLHIMQFSVTDPHISTTSLFVRACVCVFHPQFFHFLYYCIKHPGTMSYISHFNVPDTVGFQTFL